ncbi:MAG: ABC transporter permease [Bacteroidota bacterium]
MLKTTLKIAVRNVLRQKGFAMLNLTGLVVGIACCLLIGVYLQHQLSYDAFHDNADRAYRLIYAQQQGEASLAPTPDEFKSRGSAFFGPRLEAEFPEVEHVVRFSGRHELLLGRGETRFQEEAYLYADVAFFSAFSFPLRAGDPETALRDPGGIVLTESAAQRYFGNAPALGQALQMGPEQQEMTVTGVMADLPSHTHFEFDLLISMATFEQNSRAVGRNHVFDNWGYVDFFTYAVLNEGASAEAFEAKLPAFVNREIGDELVDPPQSFTMALEPITEIFLGPVSDYDFGPKGNPTSLLVFGWIGVGILLIACVNFMNLATARAANRAAEVGVRKTVGAQRSGLVVQFLAEALLLTTLATVVAVAVVVVMLPAFGDLAGAVLSADALVSVPMLLALIVGTLLVAGLAGGYPAFVLSSFRPVEVLKGRSSTSRRSVVLRKGLVVFQFTAAIALMVGTLVVWQQLDFLQNRPLGFSEDQQLVVDFGRDARVQESREAIAAELAALPGVQQVSATRSIPGGHFPSSTTEVEGVDGALKRFVPGLYEVDDHFLTQLGIEPVAGRLFSDAVSSDSVAGLILNESAVRELGYARPDDVLGKRFAQSDLAGEVVGVVRNFNHESLHHDIGPLSFRVSDELGYFVLQVDADEASGVVEAVSEAWATLVPHRPFLYRFLDESFDAQYRAEAQFARLFAVCAGLAIFVACLGLFGLAAFAAQQRTREIGIRKVLGAMVPGLLGLLVRDFLVLVVLAFGLATPLVWWWMNRWLDGFAFRIDIGPDVFVWTAAVTLVIALATVSSQALRAATADPIRALRAD